MDEFEVSEEIVSNSPLIFAADLQAIMSEALASSDGQNFKISLGSSAGKTQRPLSKLRRARDINLSAAFSPVVAKIDASNVRSQQNIRPNLHAGIAGAMAGMDVNNIEISLGNSSGRTQTQIGMTGATATVNLSKDINSWKETSNSDSSVHHVSKESGLYQACLASLMPDVVNIPLRKGSLRLIETPGKLGRSQQNITPNLHAVRAGAMAAAVDVNSSKISLGNSGGQLCCDRLELLCSEWALSIPQDSNFWKEASNAHSSLHQAGEECSCLEACPCCLMPDAVNIPILKSSLRLLETRRHIGISKEASDVTSSWHPACSACFMSDAGNIPLLEGLPSHFESQKNYEQMLHGPRPSADQARQSNDPSLGDHLASQSYVPESYFLPEITAISGHQACAATLIPEVGEILDLGSSADIFQPQNLLLSVHQDRTHDEDPQASKPHVLETYPHPGMTKIVTLPVLGVKRMTCVGGVGQCRDPEEIACLAFLQGFLTVLRDLTAAFQVSILGIETRIHWASLGYHDQRPPLVIIDIKFFIKALRTVGEPAPCLASSYLKNLNLRLRTDSKITPLAVMRLHLITLAIMLRSTTYIACLVGCSLLDHDYHTDKRVPKSRCGRRRKETSRRVRIACHRTCRKCNRKRQRVTRLTARRNNWKRLRNADMPPGVICQAAPRANKDDGYWRVQPPLPHPREGVG